MSQSIRSQVDLIREAFHYQSRFSGRVMVFKVDFPVTEHGGFPLLIQDLALLSEIGIKAVIVPGATEWIDAVLSEYGIQSAYKDGVRITTQEAMPFVEMAAFHVATRYMTALAACRADAVTGNLVRARGLGVIGGVDMAHTGKVEKIHTGPLERILEQGLLPILPCIGWSAAGKPYNVPSDEIALEASRALGAEKLFIISLHDGYPETAEPGEAVRGMHLTPSQAEEMLKETPRPGEKSGKFHGELSLALNAVRAGVERVHLVDGSKEGAVLRELFSNLGAGAMIYRDEYESIRPLTDEDIPAVLRIMEPFMEQGTLLRRSDGDIREKIGDWAVYEIDGQIHACGALHDWGEGQGEIAALAIDPDYEDMGLGSRLVRFLLEKARSRGYSRVFVLTTVTHDWFELMGFRETNVESLPELKRRAYDTARRSKIFAKNIGAR
jgi:amino-acid N-acetyltransferase